MGSGTLLCPTPAAQRPSGAGRGESRSWAGGGALEVRGSIGNSQCTRALGRCERHAPERLGRRGAGCGTSPSKARATDAVVTGLCRGYRIRELTPRNWGGTLKACILQLNVYLLGWLGFFGICTPPIQSTLKSLDSHIRRRLRAMTLKDWKRKRTMARKLIKLGVSPKTAWRGVYKGRKSLWSLSHAPAVERGLHNAYFAERGLVSLSETWWMKAQCSVAPVQLALPLG